MDNSRRSFIKNSSIALAGAALLPHHYIALQKEKEKLAIQLYGVDKAMHEDAAHTLKVLKDAGYQYIEHADYTARRFYNYTPADFRKLVADCGLILLSGHAVLKLQHWDKSAECFTPEWHHTIEDAATAGQQFLISPWLDHSLWNDETALKRFMDVFNRSGELCKKAGLQFGYHNHDFEFTHTFNSSRLYDVMLQNTDPELVAQQLDIGNMYSEDFAVTDLFAQYPGRFQLLHVKNITATNERHQRYKSAPIRDGILDVQTIVNKARQQGGTTCFIIEQDNDSALESLECARQNFLAFITTNAIDKGEINTIA